MLNSFFPSFNVHKKRPITPKSDRERPKTLRDTPDTSLIIFSVSQASKGGRGTRRVDRVNNREVYNLLRYQNRTAKPIIGSFHSDLEVSFVISAIHEEGVRELCLRYGQESYLLIDEGREAFLIDVQTGKVRHLGHFEAVLPSIGRNLRDYMRDILETKAFYVVV